MHNFFVYFHCNITTQEIFYVGKGKYQYGIAGRAYQKYSRNEYWRKIESANPISVNLIHENITNEEANYWEKFYIKLFGRIDKKTGSLVNLTAGGQGQDRSIETRQKISIGLKGKKKSEIHCLHLKENHKGSTGKTFSAESCAKMSRSQKGSKRSVRWKHTPETLKKMSDAAFKRNVARKIKSELH